VRQKKERVVLGVRKDGDPPSHVRFASQFGLLTSNEPGINQRQRESINEMYTLQTSLVT
jgi:hypothetical protein